MKTILVPTDYSESAGNALEYAVELAKTSGAGLILFHAYHMPLPSGEVPLMLISPHEITAENLKRIKDIEKAVVKSTSGKVKVESIVRSGFAADEIVDYAKEKEVDLIVMGSTGDNSVADRIMGSVATHVIQNAESPVLTIPKNIRYTGVKKIALACDYSGEPSDAALNIVMRYASLFSARLLVVDIVKPGEAPAPETIAIGLKLESVLAAAPNNFHFKKGDDVITELDAFIEENQCNWLVMIPHRYNFLSGLFHKSITKQFVLQARIPILTIHE